MSKFGAGGKGEAVPELQRLDDLFFFVKPEPEPGQEAQLFVDEVTLFDAGKP